MSYVSVVVMCQFSLDLNLDLGFVTKLIRIGLAFVPLVVWFNIQSVHTLTELAINIGTGLLIYLLSIMLLRVVTLEDIKNRFA